MSMHIWKTLAPCLMCHIIDLIFSCYSNSKGAHLESAHLISLKIAPHLNNVFLKINRISFDILIISNKMTCKKNPTHFTWRLIKEFPKELVTFRCPVQGPTRHGIFEWMTNQRSVFRILFSDWSSIKKRYLPPKSEYSVANIFIPY